ncbi:MULTISPECIES: hypothetical protein [Symbiopectobacterium]|nr:MULTISPECIES: hypothetical protein [Symbiopectobacterium]
MSNFEKYKSAFVTTFDMENENGIEQLKYQSIEAWDSVGHMGLVAAL